MSDARSQAEKERACVECPEEDGNPAAQGYCAEHGSEMRDRFEAAELEVSALTRENDELQALLAIARSSAPPEGSRDR